MPKPQNGPTRQAKLNTPEEGSSTAEGNDHSAAGSRPQRSAHSRRRPAGGSRCSRAGGSLTPAAAADNRCCRGRAAGNRREAADRSRWQVEGMLPAAAAGSRPGPAAAAAADSPPAPAAAAGIPPEGPAAAAGTRLASAARSLAQAADTPELQEVGSEQAGQEDSLDRLAVPGRPRRGSDRARHSPRPAAAGSRKEPDARKAAEPRTGSRAARPSGPGHRRGPVGPCRPGRRRGCRRRPGRRPRSCFWRTWTRLRCPCAPLLFS
mmetsp:Transcript_104678/g.300958  ORF Transcript_104678/g.300958 Transcript_104678/m.300958 type:complete len:264 (-) Transcript_104678:1467-2258(-)